MSLLKGGKCIIVCLIFFLIHIAVWCQSQVIDQVRYTCMYRYDLLEDSTSSSSVKAIRMMLLIGKKYSLFAGERKIVMDSVSYSNRNLDEKTRMGLIVSTHNTRSLRSSILSDYYVVKNYPAPSVITFLGQTSGLDYMKYEEKMGMKWEIDTGATSIVSGYRCQRATITYAGRLYEAWFTMELPINDGPYKFSGLPGLIVQLQDTQKQHCFTLVKVKLHDDSYPMLLSHLDAVEGSVSRYNEAKRAHFAKLLKEYSNGKGDLAPEVAARAIHNLKSFNNFIEKY